MKRLSPWLLVLGLGLGCQSSEPDVEAAPADAEPIVDATTIPDADAAAEAVEVPEAPVAAALPEIRYFLIADT